MKKNPLKKNFRFQKTLVVLFAIVREDPFESCLFDRISDKAIIFFSFQDAGIIFCTSLLVMANVPS